MRRFNLVLRDSNVSVANHVYNSDVIWVVYRCSRAAVNTCIVCYFHRYIKKIFSHTKILQYLNTCLCIYDVLDIWMYNILNNQSSVYVKFIESKKKCLSQKLNATVIIILCLDRGYYLLAGITPLPPDSITFTTLMYINMIVIFAQ